MKDYIIEKQSLIGEREYLQLSMKISDNIFKTMTIQLDLNKIEDQMALVMEKLSHAVTHSELAKMMNEFDQPYIKRGYLVLNGQPFKADLAYSEIYRQAKKSIYVIDNYISIKTLELLINCAPGVESVIFSDNLMRELRKTVYEDFCKEYSTIKKACRNWEGFFTTDILFWIMGQRAKRYIIVEHLRRMPENE